MLLLETVVSSETHTGNRLDHSFVAPLARKEEKKNRRSSAASTEQRSSLDAIPAHKTAGADFFFSFFFVCVPAVVLR